MRDTLMQIKNYSAHSDFQALSPVDVLEKIKISDSIALIRLIKRYAPAHYKVEELQVTDLGCGEGGMLIFFVALANRLKLTLVDIDANRCQKYKLSTVKLKNVEVDHIYVKNMGDDDLRLPVNDLILASHSLYYCKNLWYNAKISFEEHYFTKLLNSIKNNGIICIVIQSSKATGIYGANGMLANLEQLENVICLLISKMQTQKTLANNSRDHYANAEMLDEALMCYTQNASKENIIVRYMVSDPIVITIDLGDVNFKLDQHCKKYPQRKKTLDLFNFYTRGHYNNFPMKDQKQLLDFIETNCQTLDKRYVVTHVNQAFLITKPNLTSMRDQNNYISPKSSL